jgi:hypothetical protein
VHPGSNRRDALSEILKGKPAMTDKYQMSAEALENINSELFNSFDPEQELWIIGGSTRTTICSGMTMGSNGQTDSNLDYEITYW